MTGGVKKIQPIVIKKIKKGGHPHHGGAWKIAYADFVTAMMAFFLLMWLVGSTTKGDLKGIADHFSSPLKVALLGGSGAGEATSVIPGGGEDITRSEGQVRRGGGDTLRLPASLEKLAEEIRLAADAQARLIRARIEQAIDRNPRLREMRSQVRLDVTPDGLRIEIVDEQARSMFDSGSAVVKPYMRELLAELGRVLNEVEWRVTLAGHTDSAPFSSGERGYSNWELSADRANASRRELIAGGMEERKILRVVGLASVVPKVPDNPLAPVNRRISIVVMNRLAELRLLSGDDGRSIEARELEELLQRSAPAGVTGAPAAAGTESRR